MTPTPRPTSSPNESDGDDLVTCPTGCSSDPCPGDENSFCTEETRYHANGCDQCMNGYWKLGYGYACESCEDTIANCNSCTGFIGCNSCDTGYERIQSTDCFGDAGAIYYCDQIVCELYINLRDAWTKTDESSGETWNYAGKYEYTTDDTLDNV